MSLEAISDRDRQFLRFAIETARSSLRAGNIPIAALIADDESLISAGVNSRIQKGSLILHAETAALENAGRKAIPRLKSATMYCTLSPCAMCTGAILLYSIPRVIVADRKTFEGPTNTLRDEGVTVTFVDDEEAYSILREFRISNPELWNEDNGGNLMTYISHNLLVVGDIESSVSFYLHYAQLSILHRRERPEVPQQIAWLGTAGCSFRLILVQGPVTEAPVGPYGHIGISCADRNEYLALLNTASKSGILSEGPMSQPWPICEWFSIRDPDKNRIEISLGQDRPPERLGAEARK